MALGNAADLERAIDSGALAGLPAERVSLVANRYEALELLRIWFRDLLLVPASLVAGVLSLISGDSERPGPQFYKLISLGKQSEKWIDLFKAYENAPEELRLENDFAVVDDEQSADTV